MDVSKLEVGMRVKNYKVLCELLGEPTKAGNPKIRQLNDFTRYFNYEKQGHAFIITEILNKPKPKIDKRKDVHKKNNNSKYSEPIQALVISILANAKDNEMVLPVSKMLVMLDMVNENMKWSRQDIERFSEITEIPAEYAHDFFSVNNVKLKQTLERALRTLRSRALVIWEKCVTVCVMVADEEYNTFGDMMVNPKNDEYGELPYHTEHRDATKEEKELILEVEERVLDELESPSLQHVFLTGRWNYFQNRVKRILSKEANILYYYDSYKLTFNKNTVYKNYLKKLKPEERENITNILNNNICLMIEKHANTLHKRALKKEVLYRHEQLHSTADYVKYSKQMSEYVIRKNAESLRDKMIKPKEIKDKQKNTLLE